MLRCKGHGDASGQKSVMISAVPGQRMVEVDEDLSRVFSPTLLAQAGTAGTGCPRLCPAVLNISTDGDYNLPSWSVFSPLPVRNEVFSGVQNESMFSPVPVAIWAVVIFHEMLLRRVRPSIFPQHTLPLHPESSMVSSAKAQQGLHHLQQLLLRATRPCQGRELPLRKTLHYGVALVVCSISPNFVMLYFQFQQGNVLIVVGREEEKQLSLGGQLQSWTI